MSKELPLKGNKIHESRFDQNTRLSPALLEVPPPLSRSPRPYNWPRRAITKSPQLGADGSLTPLTDEGNVSDSENSRNRFYATSRQGTRSSSPLGLGIELDDEGFRSARALPAPAIRPRKGLIGSDEYEQDWLSPRATPSRLQEDDDSSQPEYFSSDDRVREEAKDLSHEQEQSRERRIREIVRRTSETAVFAFIAALVYTESKASAAQLRVLSVSAVLLSVLIVVYVMRLLLKPLLTEGRWQLGRVRLPTSFDPAILLYPVFLPFIIALSVSGTYSARLAANAVLGLSAMPLSLFPAWTQQHSLNPLHWALSLTPLLIMPPRELNRPGDDPREILSVLYPMHQLLIRPLFYLSTSSLLPAELHLLSAGLINILIYARSPPMLILKLLLWTGGIGVFAACFRACRRIVALERIHRARVPLLEGIDLPRRAFWVSLAHGFGVTARLPQLRTVNEEGEGLLKKTHSAPLNGTPAAVHQRSKSYAENKSIPDGDAIERHISRRKTLASSSPSAAQSMEARSVQPLSALTTFELRTQAVLFNAYTYLIVLILILIPIRILIGVQALDAHEPFLWALGYLFGNIAWVRGTIEANSILSTIQLPSEPSSHWLDCLRQRAWMSCLRDDVIGTANTRLLLFCYWAGVITAGIVTVLQLSSTAEVDTRRKVFHGMMVVMLLPTAYVDPMFLALGLVLVLAVFLLLDLFRAAQIKPLSKPLARFLQPYVDGRDLRGPVIVSHIFLLIGCAIPFWLSLAGTDLTYSGPWKDWEAKTRDVSMVAGVICVGMGDAAASLIGRRFGRHKWFWSGGKSLEGSFAFAAAVTVGIMAGKAWLVAGGWPTREKEDVWAVTAMKAAIAASGASFTEAVLTGCNDNVVVPIILWLLIRGLQI